MFQVSGFDHVSPVFFRKNAKDIITKKWKLGKTIKIYIAFNREFNITRGGCGYKVWNARKPAVFSEIAFSKLGPYHVSGIRMYISKN